MSFETITYETDDRVAILTLNRPERMNALNLRLCREIADAFRLADEDPAIRVVILTGAGGRAFSAGYDLSDEDQAPISTVIEFRERLGKDFAFSMTPWNCSKPVIAMIDGHCLGGGLELAQMCDMRYCSDRSSFGVVETRFSLGIVTMIMPWIIGARSRELIYTGDIIDSARAADLGLVDRVFPDQSLKAETLKIAKRMACVALDCLRFNKKSVNGTYAAQGFHAALAQGLDASVMMDACRTPEYQTFEALQAEHGLKAALQWRKDLFAPYE